MIAALQTNTSPSCSLGGRVALAFKFPPPPNTSPPTSAAAWSFPVPLALSRWCPTTPVHGPPSQGEPLDFESSRVLEIVFRSLLYKLRGCRFVLRLALREEAGGAAPARGPPPPPCIRADPGGKGPKAFSPSPLVSQPCLRFAVERERFGREGAPLASSRWECSERAGCQ